MAGIHSRIPFAVTPTLNHWGHLLSWSMRSFTALRSASRTSCTRMMSYSDRIWGNKLRAALPWPGAALGGTCGCLFWAAKAPRLAAGGQQGPQGQGGESCVSVLWLGRTLSVHHPPTQQLLQGRNLGSIKHHPALIGDQQEWRWPEVGDGDGGRADGWVDEGRCE